MHAVIEQPLLAKTLSQDYPAILVDEFQDTDQQQYAIFKGIHQAASPDHLLMLIGDPKQAIYSFRGADIHTYPQGQGRQRAPASSSNQLALLSGAGRRNQSVI